MLDAVKTAVAEYGTPAIINSDQGSQFTSNEYVDFLRENQIRQSMDGKERWVDNVIIERWFRSLKCDNIYINEYSTPRDLRRGIAAYVNEYNCERPHSEHGGDYPAEVYFRIAAYRARAPRPRGRPRGSYDFNPVAGGRIA